VAGAVSHAMRMMIPRGQFDLALPERRGARCEGGGVADLGERF